MLDVIYMRDVQNYQGLIKSLRSIGMDADPESKATRNEYDASLTFSIMYGDSEVYLDIALLGKADCACIKSRAHSIRAAVYLDRSADGSWEVDYLHVYMEILYAGE